MAAVAACNQRGRGQKRLHEVAAFRQAVLQGVHRSGVEDGWWRRSSHHAPSRAVRGSRDQPARVDEEREATVEVRVDEAALEAAGRRWGWRVSGPKQPEQPVALAPAVLADRRA
jgi:hypothetical protein